MGVSAAMANWFRVRTMAMATGAGMNDFTLLENNNIMVSVTIFIFSVSHFGVIQGS
jgi:hypothetical protein